MEEKEETVGTELQAEMAKMETMNSFSHLHQMEKVANPEVMEDQVGQELTEATEATSQ